LDAFGDVKFHSGIINDPKHQKKMKNSLQLASPTLEMNCLQQEEKAKKQRDLHAEQWELVPKAV
jgi:hypothetical protein